MFKVSGVDRIDPTEDHGMNFLESQERFARGMPLVRDGVADLDVGR